jgi:hypothetical protein
MTEDELKLKSENNRIENNNIENNNTENIRIENNNTENNRIENNNIENIRIENYNIENINTKNNNIENNYIENNNNIENKNIENKKNETENIKEMSTFRSNQLVNPERFNYRKFSVDIDLFIKNLIKENFPNFVNEKFDILKKNLEIIRFAIFKNSSPTYILDEKSEFQLMFKCFFNFFLEQLVDENGIFFEARDASTIPLSFDDILENKLKCTINGFTDLYLFKKTQNVIENNNNHNNKNNNHNNKNYNNNNNNESNNSNKNNNNNKNNYKDNNNKNNSNNNKNNKNNNNNNNNKINNADNYYKIGEKHIQKLKNKFTDVFTINLQKSKQYNKTEKELNYDENNIVYKMHSIVELKSPYNELYKNSASKAHAKEQTMFELQALTDMKKKILDENVVVVAALTDMISINILFKKGVDFYISEEVFDAEEYLYHLFFLVLDFENDDTLFENLIKKGIVNVFDQKENFEEDEDEEENVEKNVNSQSENNTKQNTTSSKQFNSDNNNNDNNYINNAANKKITMVEPCSYSNKLYSDYNLQLGKTNDRSSSDYSSSSSSSSSSSRS